uniref:NifU-like protein 1, chloroplastic n=1 Tax=Tanacetum cinerariifolium TaxID=118510 RepID=A0A699GTN3_TANCI|nr:NifU-like protein 1, chloroplastic [Tanacetum cinerariifolium]
MQTQTSNALHNAIMEAGGKDRPPMLAPCNYVQWKSRIKRYIDTKPNNELIHYCLKNLPYKFKWTEKTVPVAEGSSETTTKGYMENYKNVSQDIHNQLNAEAEAIQIILTGTYNDIYSTIDACPNACEMWKAIKRFYKMMNELVRNQCDVTNHQVNFQFLLQLQLEWQRFMTLVKQSQDLKTVSYHKLYDILKQHHNEVNEIRAERLAHTANPLALIAQQQSAYHPQHNPNHYTQNSSTRSQQTTKNRRNSIVNSSAPIYDQGPATVTEDDEMSKEKEIDKLMALISLSFKKIYKPTNNNIRTSSNTGRANQDNSPIINRGNGYENMRVVNVVGARKTIGTQVVQKSGIQCYNCKEYGHVSRECQKPKQAKDASYHKEKMLLCKQKEAGPLQKVQNDDDNYNLFGDDQEYHEQPEYVNEPYPDMCYDREQDDHDHTDELAQERDLLASLIEKLKCEIDDNKNRNKFLKTSNKALVDKLKGEIEDFKTKIKSLESSNNHFKKVNNELSKTNQLMFKDLKKFQAELDRNHLHNVTTKETQIKFYKTREDKEIDKVITLENKVKVLDNIVYKTVQTANMLNRNFKTSFAKPEFLKKAQRANPRLYDIGCYNDNLALMLAPESDETIRLDKESRSKLSDLIRLFDYDQLNNLYDLFVSQREKSHAQHNFSKESKKTHTSAKNEVSKESFNKQTTLLEKRMDESITWDQKCNSSKELFKIKKCVDTIFDGVEQQYELNPENVDKVLDDVRPYLIADGGNVDVVGVQNGVVSLKLQGACGTCPSSTTTMKMGIERVLKEKFGDAVKDIVQVYDEQPAETTVEAVNGHLDILRPAITNFGGSVEVLSVQGGECIVKYTGPESIGSGVKAAIKEKFTDIENVVLTE